MDQPSGSARAAQNAGSQRYPDRGAHRMTRANKPTVRLSYSMYRSREIVVTINATWLGLRLKGTRTEYKLDLLAAYQFAGKIAADAARRERAEAKRNAGARKRLGITTPKGF